MLLGDGQELRLLIPEADDIPKAELLCVCPALQLRTSFQKLDDNFCTRLCCLSVAVPRVSSLDVKSAHSES